LPASRYETALHWLIVALAFTIPMPVATNNLLLALLILAAPPLLGKKILHITQHNLVAGVSVLLFGYLFFGTLWGHTPWGQAMGILGKYMDLALIPVFMLLLRDPSVREHSLQAFFCIMSLVLALSWAVGMKLLPITPWVQTLIGPSATAENPSIFHSHITQGLLTSFACFLFALRAGEVGALRRRMLFAFLSLAAAANVLFLLQGRTGYAVLFTLLIWVIWNNLRRVLPHQSRHVLILSALLLPLILLWAAYHGIPAFHDRTSLAVAEFSAWQPGQNHANSSMGQRLDFYSNTARLIVQHPLMGYGTGGFAEAFARQTAQMDVITTQNPHNEYLMLAAQVGLPGALLLMLLFITQWRCAARLPPFEQVAARGLVLTYALTCLFNSMLLDHTEGLFFAFMTAWLFAPLSQRD